MATKYSFIGLLLLISGSSVFMTCNKIGLGCANSTYSFEIDARVYPDNDTVTIGDTIWIEINSSDTFTDQKTNEQVDFSNANNLGTDMGFDKLVNSSPIELEGAVDSFNFVLISGIEETSRNPSLIKNYLIIDNNNRYHFKLAIVPKSSGTFSFNLGNFTGVYRNDDPCPKADFYTKLIETNQHYYLYPGGSGVSPTGADYYFYVR